MRHLFVWVRGADNSISLAGELATSDPLPQNGRFESEFQYAQEWLDSPAGFSLDPVSLPLDKSNRTFRAIFFQPPLGVLEDALPDDWGRGLLRAAIRLEGRQPTLTDLLLRMRGGGTGALLFTDTKEAPEPDTTIQSTALPELVVAAEKFEAGTLPPEHEFRRLLEGSSRAGGARPKALVHDASGEWLVKFPSRSQDSPHDVVGLEAVCLTLARRAGLEVPDAHLLALAAKRVLMVRRFDVTPQNGRFHMVSLSTLCRERPGIYVHDYSTLARTIRKYSVSPLEDVTALFRHMVFNAAIGNVDDHLKNLWMLRKQREGYRLAPAFDLVPDITERGQHTLHFLHMSYCPGKADLTNVASQWNVDKPADIVGQVAESVSGFATVAREMEVTGKEPLAKVLKDIDRRLQTLLS